MSVTAALYELIFFPPSYRRQKEYTETQKKEPTPIYVSDYTETNKMGLKSEQMEHSSFPALKMTMGEPMKYRICQNISH